jgi:hypothetical protein
LIAQARTAFEEAKPLSSLVDRRFEDELSLELELSGDELELSDDSGDVLDDSDELEDSLELGLSDEDCDDDSLDDGDWVDELDELDWPSEPTFIVQPERPTTAANVRGSDLRMSDMGFLLVGGVSTVPVTVPRRVRFHASSRH